ncbi:MAG: glycosyltransferase family 4 protein [Actinomycetota bacterium]
MTDEEVREVRVLYVIDSLGRGGAEMSLLAIAARLRSLGARLIVVHLKEEGGLAPDLRAAGAEVMPLGSGPARIARVQALRRLVRDIEPDLVHTTLFESDITGRLALLRSTVPLVCSLVNDSYSDAHQRTPGLPALKLHAASWLDMVTARRVDHWHAITLWVADAMAPRLHIDRSEIQVIPRGRDPAVLGMNSEERRARVRKALAIDVRAFVLLCAARHEWQKGLDVAIAASARVRTELPGVRLLIAGRRGNQTGALEEQIGRLAAPVTLLDARDDVPDLMCAADLVLLPSRWEGLGGTILEAMCLGAPVIASDLPPFRETIGDDALFTPPGSVDALSAAIRAVAQGPAEAAERAERARRRFFDHYTTEQIARRTMAFYRSATSARRRASR